MKNIVSNKGYVVTVASSMIDSIAYLASSETLWVEFKPNGDVYEYPAVSVDLASDLRTAISHGKFLNDSIKPFHSGRKANRTEYTAFCDLVQRQSILVPIVNINWNAVSAAADQMVWNRC